MRYQFDEFTLDTGCFELSKNGVTIPAEPQVIELLVLLVDNGDRMISKEEINQKIWKGRIVSEAALSSRIKSARQVLGDSGQAQKYIRTIHKKGFRFIGELKPVVESIPQKNVDESPDVEATSHYSMTKTELKIQPTQNKFIEKPAVAILPFANLSSEAEQEYFSDGITADIITHLSKHRWVDVTARNTSFGYKGKMVNIPELAKQLNVNYVVEGSVQRVGNRVRVTAHLVEAKSGHPIWVERYDREIADIFALQDDITEKIVARVEPEIGFAERNRVVHARPANLQAWDCYHLGVYHLFKFTGSDNRESQSLLHRSFELDKRFGEAYAWWAYAVILGMVYWDTPPTQALLDEALTASDMAISLDSQNATFRALKARILLARCEYDRALAENEIAIKLNPTFAAAHCGLGDSLAYEGRYDESIDCFERAIALSPNDPQVWAFLTYGALAHIFKKDYDNALDWTERASSIPNCQYWTTAHRAVALAKLNRLDEAQKTAIKLKQQNPDFSIAFAKEKLFYLKQQDQIDLYLDGLRLAGIN